MLLFGSLFLLFAACAPKPAPPPLAPPPPLQAVGWHEVDGWLEEDPGPAVPVFLRSCQVLRNRPGWDSVCEAAALLDPADGETVRAFFESRFIPYRISNGESTEGLITGYYIPDLRGSRSRSEQYSRPLYGIPDDLLVIDLRNVYPELGDYRLRGRLEGRRVVPYFDRGAIDGEGKPLRGNEICWVKDPVELFFLHIQGSGRITLDDGSVLMVNYADQNGHPYRSIGKLLLERGAMTPNQMSMQNIRAWARTHPEEVGQLLAENPSYIFFRELGENFDMPPGALGVPLTPARSLAVDPRTTPLGAPVFLATTWPNSPTPLKQLMVAQDTGGAIKGAVRADFFWGAGEEAGAYAGRMKQSGRMWVLLPAAVPPPTRLAER
ncbi:MAG: MltA domain-containing protein [Desulfuromonadales bacterium]